MQKITRLLTVVILAFVALASRPALAGTVSLAWDPVPDTDLAGYKVYYGTSPTAYAQSVDVGNVNQTTISGLTDCTVYYFGVKAYDTSANESTTYSNQLQGMSRPIVGALTPNAAEAGRTLTLTLAGANFQSGATTLFSKAGITVNSTTFNACGQLALIVTVGGATSAGVSDVDVTNIGGVFGTGTAAFTVLAAVAPTVASMTPADGATGVSVAVNPTVTFSEAMLPLSITTATVRLLDDTGAAVALAAGSPSLSANGLTATITPAASLAMGKTYKIQIVGGGVGVLDLSNHGLAATTVQATGFTTAGDATAPTISAVASTGVSSTTASITWTTNENADSQVFFRRIGDAAYQATGVLASLVTSHSVGLTGLDASTSYEYYVSSADAAGNTTASTPVSSFATGGNAFTYLRFEAESGALVAPVRSVAGAAGAFDGGYIDTPPGTPNGTATTPAGTATYGVNVPSSGTWYLWVRLYGPDANTNMWYESVNGAARQQLVPTVTGQWQWVAGRSYALPAGLSTVELGGRNAQARADRILLTNDATFVPSEQAVGDQTPPAGVASFTAVPATAQVTLSWTNPASSDFNGTIVRYRTDGKFPVSPVDGFPVVVKAGAPGSADGFVHTGLTNGTTYSYSAFAVDSSGNVAASAKVSATVIDTTAPAPVRNLRRADTRTP